MARSDNRPAPDAGTSTGTAIDWAAARRAGEQTRARGMLGRAARYETATRRVLIELTNGVLIGLPVAQLPEIAGASNEALEEVEVLGAGGILHWETLDADYDIPALITMAFGRQLATRELARRAGTARSPQKAAAARANGRKGGRPKKKVKG